MSLIESGSASRVCRVVAATEVRFAEVFADFRRTLCDFRVSRVFSELICVEIIDKSGSRVCVSFIRGDSASRVRPVVTATEVRIAEVCVVAAALYAAFVCVCITYQSSLFSRLRTNLAL